MSENKPKLSEFLKEQFKANNQALLDQVKKLIENSSSTSKSEKHEHTHSANVQFDCPECQKNYDTQIINDFQKQKREKLKSSKDVEYCIDCGEVYDGEERDDCPNCGSSK